MRIANFRSEGKWIRTAFSNVAYADNYLRWHFDNNLSYHCNREMSSFDDARVLLDINIW